MAAEAQAFIHAADMGMIVKDGLNEFLYRSVEIESFVGSRTLFRLVTKTVTQQRADCRSKYFHYQKYIRTRY